MASRARRLAPALLLFLLGPLAYHRMLRPGWAAVDYDLVLYFHPYRQYLADAWAHGRWLPLWNPRIYLGVPFLANIQAAALYPPNLLLALGPTETVISWLIALHAGLAGAGMYLYALYGLRLRPAGSSVAGLVYMLSAYLVGHSGHLNQNNTLAWAPWLMLAADRAARRPSPPWLAAVAALTALIVLAGHTQQAYYAFLLAAIAAGRRLWGPAIRRRAWRPVATAAGLLALAAALGGAIAAVQLAATLELTRWSNRSGGLPIAEAGSFALPVKGIAGLLLPDYSNEHPAEFAGSVGAAALLLIAVALLARRPRLRTWGWAGLGAVALVAALGPKARLYDVFYYALPGFDLFRVPARLLLFSTVSAAVLAGQGVLALQQLASRRAAAARVLGISLLVASAPFLALWLFAGRSPLFPPLPQSGNAVRGLLLAGATALAAAPSAVGWRRPAAAIPIVVAADLLLLAAPTYAMHPLPASLYAQKPAAAPFVPHSLDERYLSLVPFEAALPEQDRVPAQLDPVDRARYAGYLHQLDPMVPDFGMARGPLDADGYDGGLLPTRSYVDFRTPLLPPGSSNRADFTDHLLTDRVYSAQWLGDAAVATVITTGGDPNPPGCVCLVRVGTARGLAVWRTVRPVVRAHLADGTPARVVEDTGERLRVELPAGAGGRLVLADSWYPGWTATVDGRTVTVERYLGALRSVDLPSGAREVVFEYRPGWLAPSSAVSVLALLVTASLALWPLLRARPRAAARLR